MVYDYWQLRAAAAAGWNHFSLGHRFRYHSQCREKKAKVNCNKHNFSISWNVVWLLRSFLHFKLFRAVKFTAMFCSGRLCPIVCAARKKPTVDGAATRDEIELRQFGMPQVFSLIKTRGLLWWLRGMSHILPIVGNLPPSFDAPDTHTY